MRPPSGPSPTTPAKATLRAQGPEHRGHAAGAAKPLLAAIRPQQNDRGLLADALGIAPDITIQHEVAYHQHARPAQTLHQIEQFRGHGVPFPGDVRSFAAAPNAQAACAGERGCTRRQLDTRRDACSSGSRISWWPISSMPSALGRSSTLTRERYWACLSRLTVTRPSRSWPKLLATDDRLDEDFRHDDGTAEVHPDAVGHGGDDAAQAAEVGERRFAQGSAADVRVHVNDVGAEGDVDRAGDAGAIGGQHQA